MLCIEEVFDMIVIYFFDMCYKVCLDNLENVICLEMLR